MCILTALGSQRLYGYDIVRCLRAIDGLVISEGTVYPILARFRREGLVTASIEESSEGPPRKYYELTPAGRKHLGRMSEYWRRMKRGVDKLGEQSS